MADDERRLARVLRSRADNDAAAILQTAAQLRCGAVFVRACDAIDLPAAGGAAAIETLARAAASRGVAVFAELRLDRMSPHAAIVATQPSWFRRSDEAIDAPLDPRIAPAPTAQIARLDFAPAAAGIAQWHAERLAPAWDAGLAGLVLHWPQCLPRTFTRQLFDALRERRADARFVAWTPGTDAGQRHALADAGYDACVCSLPWWDFRAPWFAEELVDLRRIGRVLAPLPMPGNGDRERDERARRRALEFAGACCDGTIFDADDAGVYPALDGAAAVLDPAPAKTRAAHPVGAPWSRIGAWLDASLRTLLLVNSDLDKHVAVPITLAEQAGLDSAELALPAALAPAEVRRIALPVVRAMEPPRIAAALDHALAAPRVAIESIAPSVDDGRFPAKCTVGEDVVVGADAFADGHPALAVHLLWRECDADAWTRVRMEALGNDRWCAQFRAKRLGTYEYAIEAGIDSFASFRADLAKKVAANQAGALDAAQGRLLIEAAAQRAPQALAARLRALAREIATAEEPLARLLAPECAALLSELPPAFATQSAVHAIVAERRAARFGAWYELFPRSQGRPGEHGTFADVIAQLPRIAAMGFDVLYFPPIHPIGTSQRKGRNNALAAQPGDPGSAYAIGAAEGGHDAVHPALGTLEDFRALVAAASAHGLEIALDFAVQCSPDHPWIRAHPEWFDWRPDGSLRHAENPPKKYEDIVNVDFYNARDAAGLWRALRDVVAFWIGQGVRIFRVDNPHTKPLPFWQWLIAEARALDPGVIFLSEAFTRPKPMYRLAKIGFSQSYTYFTWRNTRTELQDYLRELNAEPVRWFFRPHFFVNTPDINPYFLQTSGRAGFLIRAALAATLSGLWGLYSGFELCESAPLPGREEYLDSEKYELRSRDWDAPGNIAAEIAQLNRIRRANPALHTHLGIAFYHCSNAQVLYFAKATPARDNVVLVAISVDPHQAQEADVELPLWEWGLPDDGALLAEDLLRGDAFEWRGKQQRLRLDPSAPYRLWRLRREETFA